MYGKSVQGTRADIQSELAQIQVSNIPNAEGVYLRNALIDRFHKDQSPADTRYHLSVSPIQEQIIDLDITKTSDATRGQLRVSTTMILANAQSGETLLTRNLKSVTSYNILASEFATRVSEDNTRKNALDDLARQIEQQIALYLRR
jgi:LPS-assembly lipoprotein